MYMLIEAPDVNLGCHPEPGVQNWVLGLLRSKTFSRAGTWEQFGDDGGSSPTVVPAVKEGCYIQYHRLFADEFGTYLEYWAGFGSGWMQVHKLVPGKGALPIVATDNITAVIAPHKTDDGPEPTAIMLKSDDAVFPKHVKFMSFVSTMVAMILTVIHCYRVVVPQMGTNATAMHSWINLAWGATISADNDRSHTLYTQY
jgi:hypothetical protein